MAVPDGKGENGHVNLFYSRVCFEVVLPKCNPNGPFLGAMVKEVGTCLRFLLAEGACRLGEGGWYDAMEKSTARKLPMDCSEPDVTREVRHCSPPEGVPRP